MKKRLNPSGGARSFRPAIIPVLLAVLFFAAPGVRAEDPPQDDNTLAKLLETRVSSASRYLQTLREAPAAVTIITDEDIRRNGFRTLAEALNSISGFFITDDRNYTYLGVRGFGRPSDYTNRVLVQINGHTLNESVYGSAPVGTDLGLDLGAVERIEVVKGPGSALYGAGAMFAVVNLIMKKGGDLDGVRISAEAGSPGLVRGAVTVGRELGKGVDVFLSAQGTSIAGEDVYIQEFDAPETNHGIARGLDRDHHFGLFGSVSAGGLRLQALSVSRDKAYPTAAWGVIFNDDRAETRDQRIALELDWAGKLSPAMSLDLRAAYDDYSYKGWYPYDTLSLDSSRGRAWLGEARFQWDLRANNRFVAGMLYQSHVQADYRQWDAGGVFFYGDYPFRLWSFYLHDEFEAARNLSFVVGLRHDSYSSVGGSTTPRVAVLWHAAPSTTFKLLYGEAFRKPTIYETYYEDAFTNFKANPNIRPERIRTAEIVWEQTWGRHLFGSMSLYRYVMRGLIDQRTDPADGWVEFVNLSRVVAVGLEADLHARLGSGLEIYAGYTLQAAKDSGTGLRLTNQPRHLLNAGVSFPVRSLFAASLRTVLEAGRMTVRGTRTPGFALVNANFTSEPLFGHLRLALAVRNLLDASYKLPGGFEHVPAAIVQEGRTVSLKAEWTF
ncbi:MAG: TonB-dependent receptor plug domain-containing protein [Candidatus Aminicenantales bacterium]